MSSALTPVQETALVAAARAEGLIFLAGKYRTGWRPGARQFRASTVKGLIDRGFLEHAGPMAVNVTAAGRKEAERLREVERARPSRAVAASARHARRQLEERERFERTRNRKREAYLADKAEAPQWRKPYAD